MKCEYGRDIDGIIVTEETVKDSEKSLPHCHFVYHKSHMDIPGSEPVFFSEKLATTRLPHGKVLEGLSLSF
jgi:hypothetical protein